MFASLQINANYICISLAYIEIDRHTHDIETIHDMKRDRCNTSLLLKGKTHTQKWHFLPQSRYSWGTGGTSQSWLWSQLFPYGRYWCAIVYGGLRVRRSLHLFSRTTTFCAKSEDPLDSIWSLKTKMRMFFFSNVSCFFLCFFWWSNFKCSGESSYLWNQC